MPVGAAIVALIILALVFNSPKKQRWKCPAPGCDFNVEGDKKAQADAHALAHMKHQPQLKDV